MAEVPGTWPPAAVQAQTIAARTYALRAMSGGGEICDDARCQVYSGAGAESPGQDAAVAATARKVLAFRSEEHTSELQSLMSISYGVLCLKKKSKRQHTTCRYNVTCRLKYSN